MNIKISAILLAAGLSQRMGEDKLRLNYHGKSLLRHSLDLMAELPVFERIVVTTDARSKCLTFPHGIRSCINANPEKGLSGSIHAGVKAAAGTHYMFLNADQPKLLCSDLLPMLEAVSENPDKIIFPAVGSNPKSPVIFPNRFKGELLKLSGDNGGRKVRDANREQCLIFEPENPGNFTDIDDKTDYFYLGME